MKIFCNFKEHFVFDCYLYLLLHIFMSLSVIGRENVDRDTWELMGPVLPQQPFDYFQNVWCMCVYWMFEYIVNLLVGRFAHAIRLNEQMNGTRA